MKKFRLIGYNKPKNNNILAYIYEYDYNSFTFSGGEIHSRLEIKELGNAPRYIEIQAHLSSGNNIIELLNIKNIIDKYFKHSIKKLRLYYTMFSRQDRAANRGEAESLKVFCNLINSMNFDEIITYDNHSEVTNALLNNNTEITQLEIFRNIITKENADYDYVISPDAGANKKAFKIAQYLGIPMIQADKIRDTSTGNILKTKVYATEQELGYSKVLIPDDICDGGRTVIEISKILKKDKRVKTVDCYFTHGIFSKGLDVLFDAGIDNILTTDSIDGADDYRINRYKL